MKELVLVGVNYDINFAKHLSLCIHMIKKLCLVGGRIIEQGFATLVDQIHQLDKPVKYCDVVY